MYCIGELQNANKTGAHRTVSHVSDNTLVPSELWAFLINPETTLIPPPPKFSSSAQPLYPLSFSFKSQKWSVRCVPSLLPAATPPRSALSSSLMYYFCCLESFQQMHELWSLHFPTHCFLFHFNSFLHSFLITLPTTVPSRFIPSTPLFCYFVFCFLSTRQSPLFRGFVFLYSSCRFYSLIYYHGKS